MVCVFPREEKRAFARKPGHRVSGLCTSVWSLLFGECWLCRAVTAVTDPALRHTPHRDPVLCTNGIQVQGTRRKGHRRSRGGIRSGHSERCDSDGPRWRGRRRLMEFQEAFLHGCVARTKLEWTELGSAWPPCCPSGMWLRAGWGPWTSPERVLQPGELGWSAHLTGMEGQPLSSSPARRLLHVQLWMEKKSRTWRHSSVFMSPP